jgi:phytoene dehydrogenase-like protein
MPHYDAVVVGAGPNGLAAAIRMAQAGRSVLVLEANETIGGGARTMELTLPGFLHDPCSAIHPLAAGSPFFQTLPLHEHGLTWIHPPSPLAHPFDDGTAAMLERSLDATLATLGQGAAPYHALLQHVVAQWDNITESILGPLRPMVHPWQMLRFGVRAIQPAQRVALQTLPGGRAGALFAGNAAHSGLPLSQWGTAAFGLVLLASGHTIGWPMPRGGAGAIADALASYLRTLGGEIVTSTRVHTLDELPSAPAIFLDLTPRQILAIAGERFPAAYRRRLTRFRYGVGVFKVDWALSEPIPWTAAECHRAGTIHIGGSAHDVIHAEHQPWHGHHAARPFVLLAQPSRFDATRAPEGRHTAWAYCHVPNGSSVDMTKRIESQIERFAPGFRDVILARHAMGPNDLERLNANLVGGDINGGAPTLDQLFTRPIVRWNPYTTPRRGLYLCSASTPPGGGVHGMCGFHAAETALADGY